MDLLSKKELEELSGKPEGPCASIFLPTHRAGSETRQDPIRLKNLLVQARERLVARGLRTAEADRILEPAQGLLKNELIWRHQGDGLVLFLSPGAFRSYRLPLYFGELVAVTDRYHLKPLLPLLTGDGRFYVLALSQNEVRLLGASRYSVDEVEFGDDVPKSLADALKFDDPEKQLQLHTGASGGGGGGRAAVFHGHGAEDDSKDDILRYFRKIDRGLRDILKGQEAPLVVAGVDYLLPIYREANTYPRLVEEGATANPEELSTEELHERAWEITGPRFSVARREAAERYAELAGTGRTFTDPREVVPAAYYGRVDTIFAASEDGSAVTAAELESPDAVATRAEVGPSEDSLIEAGGENEFWIAGPEGVALYGGLPPARLGNLPLEPGTLTTADDDPQRAYVGETSSGRVVAVEPEEAGELRIVAEVDLAAPAEYLDVEEGRLYAVTRDQLVVLDSGILETLKTVELGPLVAQEDLKQAEPAGLTIGKENV